MNKQLPLERHLGDQEAEKGRRPIFPCTPFVPIELAPCTYVTYSKVIKFKDQPTKSIDDNIHVLYANIFIQ